MSNRLAASVSSYLKSAAHQPVEWHPWGPEAFARAEAEKKPILLDIGAVWCHWCHVMDGESYEDPDLAKQLNRDWVCIKVDRDERPDVDARYQRAVQALTGQGGWPLTAFLTPNGDVFYGGTYFPPDDSHGRPSFTKVLTELATVYKRHPDRVTAQAAEIRKHLADHLAESDHNPSSRIPAHASSCSPAGSTAAKTGRSTSCGRRSCRWPGAACTTRSAVASIAIPRTRAGSCRTSRRCRTTTPSCCAHTRTPLARRPTPSSPASSREYRTGCTTSCPIRPAATTHHKMRT
jgi:hypothetical protein